MSRATWLRETAARPCPPWCSRLAGHPLRVEAAGTAQRTHVLAYGPVTVRQVETARGDGVRLGPVEVTTDGLDAVDVTSARRLARSLARVVEAVREPQTP